MDIEKVRGLSGGAARLLAVYMLLGGKAGETSTKDVMRLAGINDRSNFRKARKSLEDAGFVVKARTDTYRFSSALYSASSASTVEDSLRSPLPDLIDMTRSDLILSNLSIGELNRLLVRPDEKGVVNMTTGERVNVTTNEVNTTTNEVTITPGVNMTTNEVNMTPSEVNITTPLSLLDRCMDTDEMDGSGLETSRNSPFFLRRQAQLPLVKETWKQFFPNVLPLNDQSAKQYLSWCDNRAALVYEGIETLVSRTKDIKSPVAFMNKALRGWAAEQQAAPLAPTPRPAATTSPARRMSEHEAVTKGDSITNDELIHVSDEERQKMKEFSAKYAEIEW